MTHFVAIQFGYYVALAALTSCALLSGSGQMKRTMGVIFAVMAAAWILRGGWPSSGYAASMIAVDAIACVAITWHPAGKWQGLVGLSYILQIGIHVGRIASGENADMNAYWWGLSMIAMLQLILVGGWMVNAWLDLSRHRRSSADPRPHEARHAGAAR